MTKDYIFPTTSSRSRRLKSDSYVRHSQWPSLRSLAHSVPENSDAAGDLPFCDDSDINPHLLSDFAAVRYSFMGPVFSKELFWWDRELDSTGRPIRTDVRSAAIELWENACQQANAVLGDACEAAALMEHSVVQISRYLDRRGAALSSSDPKRLLMCAFCRGLRRHAFKLRRIELAGNINEISTLSPSRSRVSQEDCRLDAEKAARQLSERGRAMYELRSSGFEWKEIAQILNTTDAAARAEYSRELKRVRANVNGKCSPTGNQKS